MWGLMYSLDGFLAMPAFVLGSEAMEKIMLDEWRVNEDWIRSSFVTCSMW
ncbi:hypothetical protein KC19_9G081100 [Ceratodon purpureus]|uniref:Uncharacterized protein n=1 Tax=Ceratodon purpureus TaxID=3225 RepID=A0A8T0GPW6_CERPU|nr:hypothetical protein KC19_9G080900 [Ceratodon purpureus]KAG0561646.1 hypothetical protein KC19_9G081100 [Ceratodon purpureus]